MSRKKKIHETYVGRARRGDFVAANLYFLVTEFLLFSFALTLKSFVVTTAQQSEELS